MATKSKSARIFADDDSALEELTRLLRHSRADVVHEALAECLAHHREELMQLYDETQQAIAAGDLVALARTSTGRRQAEVDAIMVDLPA